MLKITIIAYFIGFVIASFQSNADEFEKFLKTRDDTIWLLFNVTTKKNIYRSNEILKQLSLKDKLTDVKEKLRNFSKVQNETLIQIKKTIDDTIITIEEDNIRYEYYKNCENHNIHENDGSFKFCVNKFQEIYKKPIIDSMRSIYQNIVSRKNTYGIFNFLILFMDVRE